MIILDQRQQLIDRLASILGDTVAVITDDGQKARPLPDRPAVLIDPPTILYDKWRNEPETTWTLLIIAGTMTTQAAALTQILTAIDLLADADMNISRAVPYTYTPTQAACYQVTFNPPDNY